MQRAIASGAFVAKPDAVLPAMTSIFRPQCQQFIAKRRVPRAAMVARGTDECGAAPKMRVLFSAEWR